MIIISDKEIKKRFPADVQLEENTFLNDKKIDGELYAIFQELSYPIVKSDGLKKYDTIVSKDKIPKQSELCDKLKIKSTKTVRTHLNYLIEKGYIEKLENGDYLLPEQESIYFLIPLKTLKYLNDNCKDHVIKIYVYLGQKYKYGVSKGELYEFTSEEIGKHVGIKVKNNSKGYEIINNALELLYNSGLIDYCEYFDGVMRKKKLTNFSFEYKTKK